MNLKALFQKIESNEFAAYLGAASDLKTFFRAAKQEGTIYVLLEMLDSFDRLQEVFFRLHDLSQDEVDPRYENRWDTALSVYVWVLSLKDRSLGKLAAGITLQAAQLGWAEEIAHQILQKDFGNSKTDLKYHEFGPKLPGSAVTTRTSHWTDADISVSIYTPALSKKTQIRPLQPHLDGWTWQTDNPLTNPNVSDYIVSQMRIA